MGNETLLSLSQYEYKHPRADYSGPVKYNVNGIDYDIAAWNHPATLAKHILNFIKHTIFYGVYIVAPMGHGKTAIAQGMVHHIHTKDPDFSVVWAGEHEFTHQEQFFNSLPKKKTVIVFDDISGALKQLTDKQIEANFSNLTKIRWILDPAAGQIEVIVIIIGHYSKNLEKEFRAQLGMSIYAAFGNEERTNLDTLAEKGSSAYKTLIQFGKIYNDMFSKDKFFLHLPNGKRIEYETDKPFRCLAAISKIAGKIILYSKFDLCDKCVKKKNIKLVKAKEVLDIVVNAYGSKGIKAMQAAMLKRGFNQADERNYVAAVEYVENKILPVFDFDFNDMVKEIRTRKHWQLEQKTVYHKRKAEFAGLEELYHKAVSSDGKTEIPNNRENTGYE